MILSSVSRITYGMENSFLTRGLCLLQSCNLKQFMSTVILYIKVHTFQLLYKGHAINTKEQRYILENTWLHGVSIKKYTQQDFGVLHLSIFLVIDQLNAQILLL